MARPQVPMARPQVPPVQRAMQFQDAARKNPLAAMRMAGVPPKGISPQPSQGIGNLAGNMAIVPDKLISDFSLYRDVLRHLAKAAAAGLASNIDPETVSELKQETETVGIETLGRQFLGNKFSQLDQDTYKDMSEEEIAVEAASGGGLMALAAGGEFNGRVPGRGHGMQDNVYMPIQEEAEQVGTLAVSPKEYVVDSYTMAALGNGNPDEGANVMDAVVDNIREQAYGTDQQPNQINGLDALRPMMERV
jgi:hypothetical protein